MSKTHPVNALKKLGIGLAFGAATIMSMPTSALACTQMYMGNKLTADGDTYYGRAEDFDKRYLKHFGIEPSHGPGHTYGSDESAFMYTSTKTTYRYTYVRDHPSQWHGRYDAYSEAGINEKGVSCSATLTTGMNADAEAADPLTKTGIGEYSYGSVILGESANAREGVELLGKIIDEQGACGNDQIIIADSNETWLFAALSGHQWIAMRLTDDIASLNPNIGNLNYKVDLTDTANCLHSATIESMPKENGFAKYFDDGQFDVAQTYGEAISEKAMHSWARYVQGRAYFGVPLTEGTDYEIVKDEREDARATTGALVSKAQPLFFQPGKFDWNTFEMIRAFGNRGEKVPGLNANTDGAYAIGTETNTEVNLFQIRQGMDPEIATIQWEMLSRAAYSVAIPYYSALLTEVSPYYSDQTVSFDHCEEEDIVNNEEPENSINYVLMDISSLCFEHREQLGTGVRAYLDALQNELIEQNLEVDKAMLAETTTEGRTALANKAGNAATKNTYVKCKALLQEMRAYLKAEDFSKPFTPSDLNTETNGLKVSITYAKDALATEQPGTPDKPEQPGTPDKPEQPGTPEKPEQPGTPDKPTKPSTTTTVTTNKTNTKGNLPTTGDRFDGRMVAAFAAAGVVVISAGGYFLYRRNKE